MNSDCNLRCRLLQRMGMSDVEAICRLAADGDDVMENLFALIADADDRVRVNALWVLTHFPASAN